MEGNKELNKRKKNSPSSPRPSRMPLERISIHPIYPCTLRSGRGIRASPEVIVNRVRSRLTRVPLAAVVCAFVYRVAIVVGAAGVNG